MDWLSRRPHIEGKASERFYHRAHLGRGSLDAFIPGVGDTTNLFLLKDLWHFHFYGPTPLALVTGRERIYFEHFWNDFAADGKKSVSEADRQFYVKKYALPGAMKAGVPRYAEIISFSDDPGEAAANYFVFKLMGYPDVKVWMM